MKKIIIIKIKPRDDESELPWGGVGAKAGRMRPQIATYPLFWADTGEKHVRSRVQKRVGAVDLAYLCRLEAHCEILSRLRRKSPLCWGYACLTI